MDELKGIESTALAKAADAATADAVAQLRSEFLGKKGTLGSMLRRLGQLSAEERPAAGKKINETKIKIEKALREALNRIESSRQMSALEAGRWDVSLPGRRRPPGAPHPLRLVEVRVIESLSALGFKVADGPLVEHDWYNFEALNIPEEHPARDMQDTFFVVPRVVLRTHTSNVQIRTMMKHEPPVRILAPGMVFRNDEIDPTHSPCFHQVEGLWIDQSATFADLKGVLRKLAADLFGPGVSLRFRPSFFPFTEPSAEVDVSCFACVGRKKGRFVQLSCL